MNEFLNRSLARYAEVLEIRKGELRDCNGELTSLSENLDACMEAWYSDLSPIEVIDSTSHHVRTAAYILPCPNLHPIPYENLERLIKQSAEQIGLRVCQLASNAAIYEHP
jgi:hypothetical protein